MTLVIERVEKAITLGKNCNTIRGVLAPAHRQVVCEREWGEYMAEGF
jgi:hypothetical protein